LSTEPQKIHVEIKYKCVEQKFSAEPEKAWLLMNQFFKDMVPSFEIAQKLYLKVDLQQLAKDLSGVVAYSQDGASLLLPKSKLTDNEALLVWLVAYYLGFELGLVDHNSLSKEELQIKLGKSSKITSTRLGELVKNELVAKLTDDRFKITTFGVIQVQKDIVPRIKAKIPL
jgi:hypothetical protein